MTKPRRFVPSIAPAEPDPHDAYWFAFRGNDMLVCDGAAIPATRARQLVALGLPPRRTQYLGTLDGVPAYAAELADDSEAPEGHQFVALRALLAALDAELSDVVGAAFQIQYWDAVHQVCGACATPLRTKSDERAKECPGCALTVYPRVSPCAIVLVHDGRRALLARAPRFPAGMYALVAGFVEAGESLEACAVREVREETGIEIDGVEYFGSQPWPFPHQLMVGFTARYVSGEIRVDPSELDDARWFDVDALPTLPPRRSIARAIIEAWIARARML